MLKKKKKTASFKIIQIMATMGHTTPAIWGLGTDQQVYSWNYKTGAWELEKDSRKDIKTNA